MAKVVGAECREVFKPLPTMHEEKGERRREICHSPLLHPHAVCPPATHHPLSFPPLRAKK